jgi:hypothetical protein
MTANRFMSFSGFLASSRMSPAVPHIMAAPIATTLDSTRVPAADFISEKPESQRIVDRPLASAEPAKVKASLASAGSPTAR